MKARFGQTVLAAAAAALAVPALHAADLPDQSLSDYKLGETVSGEAVKMDDLDGRVVVFEYWGTQ